MNAACREFRAALVAALEQRRALAELAIDAHFATCADCRALLEEERALDALLSEWPHPTFGDERVERLLRRLARDRAEERAARALDALLDRAGSVQAPLGLSSRVLHGLRAERAGRATERETLDRVLDNVPAPVAPSGLATRVRRSLERERTDARERTRRAPLARVLRVWTPLAAAAALLVSLSLWGAWQWRERKPKRPSRDLLAELELLESIELLQGSDVDVLLSELADEEVELLQATSETEDAAPSGGGAGSNG